MTLKQESLLADAMVAFALLVGVAFLKHPLLPA